MFVLISRNDPELSEVNSHARLSHSKQLLKKCSPSHYVAYSGTFFGHGVDIADLYCTEVQTHHKSVAEPVTKECLMDSHKIQQTFSFITFYVSRRPRKMYCGHARLCVCLSAAVCPHCCTDPDVTWGSGRGCPPSCALLGGFAIGAWVALLWQHNANAKC